MKKHTHRILTAVLVALFLLGCVSCSPSKYPYRKAVYESPLKSGKTYYVKERKGDTTTFYNTPWKYLVYSDTLKVNDPLTLNVISLIPYRTKNKIIKPYKF